MTTANLQVRRATVEDLPKLIPLWQEDQLPSSDLEKRFKEFQVVESTNGELLGALGLLTSGLEALVHSEVFAHPEQADLLRDRLWERMQILADNHGFVRIWTQLQTPFWRMNGFRAPTPEMAGKLPPSFAAVQSPWLVVQLREEPGGTSVLDKEFAIFEQAQKEERARTARHARMLKIVASVLGVAVFVLVIVWAILFIKAQGRLPKP